MMIKLLVFLVLINVSFGIRCYYGTIKVEDDRTRVGEKAASSTCAMSGRRSSGNQLNKNEVMTKNATAEVKTTPRSWDSETTVPPRNRGSTWGRHDRHDSGDRKATTTGGQKLGDSVDLI
ncbi:hypothetical protein WR25_15722 [Diploscapter pachys]|uniref:Secreted protein n=1 Tax=Diploscapter pachys TaxID=2018661 RepID=A0A2A2J3X0_9BILA|nr:hypothetical protein WR25_15722 [Diploscapter pachys]